MTNDPTTIKARIAEKFTQSLIDDGLVLPPLEGNTPTFIINKIKEYLVKYDKELNSLIPSASPYKHLTPAQLVDVIEEREEQMGKFIEDRELLNAVQNSSWELCVNSKGMWHVLQPMFPEHSELIGKGNSIRQAIRNAIIKQKEKE